MTTLFAFVLLLSVLIFVHEMGHFLAARACGVRVLKFSMGFGPPIGIGRFRLAWRRKGTDYVIAWFPLGGFVKMLGENLDELEDAEVLAHPDESLNAKPTWQKLFIVFAGPAMNLLLPVALFLFTLAVGMPRGAAVVGTVEPGSPAAEAGLAPGDAIRSVDGKPIEWWTDFDDAVRASAGRSLTLARERGGETSTVVLPVRDHEAFDEFGQLKTLGWVGAGHPRISSMLGVPNAGSPAFEAGLRSGDIVTAVGDKSIESWQDLAAAYAAAGSDGRVSISARREDPKHEKPEEALALELPALGDVSRLGVVPANVLVDRVEAGSPAEKAGMQPGDLILAVDGAPVGSFGGFADTVRASKGRPLEIALARDGRTQAVKLAPALAATDVGLGVEEPRYRVGVAARSSTLQGTVAIDKVRNPIESVPRAVGMTVDMTRDFLKGLGMMVTGEVSRNQIAGPIGIAQIAGNAFEQGREIYLSIMVLISINLGVLNLLPIPILDGGQALLFAIEGLRRGPISLRTREIVQQIGFTVLLLIMGLAFWNDLSRQWVRLVDWLGRNGPPS
jgi:regulator of sigma E protease